MHSVKDFDPVIYSLIKQEEQRQADKIRMIASENYVSKAVPEICWKTVLRRSADYPYVSE